jgi:hypothetical protein
MTGEGGIMGKKITGGGGGDKNQGNDSLVTEALLLRLTECESLTEIRVISLRNQQLTGCLKTLSKCENLTIAYLQGNFIQERDLMFL